MGAPSAQRGFPGGRQRRPPEQFLVWVRSAFVENCARMWLAQRVTLCVLFEDFPGADAGLRGAIRRAAERSCGLMCRRKQHNNLATWCSDSSSAARGGCAAVVLMVFFERTVSASGGPGWASRPAAHAVSGQTPTSVRGECCQDFTGEEGGFLCAVLRGFQGRTLSAAGGPERSSAQVRSYMQAPTGPQPSNMGLRVPDIRPLWLRCCACEGLPRGAPSAQRGSRLSVTAGRLSGSWSNSN